MTAFFGVGITGRGGSSSMSGSSLGLIPKTSKGSGDPEPNLMKFDLKITFLVFEWICSFLKWMHTFLSTHIPHTHGKNGCTVFRNIPTVFHGGCLVLHGRCAI